MKISKRTITTSNITSAEKIIDEDIIIDDDYIEKLQSALEANIEADTIIWETDSDSIYMTTTIRDNIMTYTIPIPDLTGDIHEDVKYILESVDTESEENEE